MEKYVRVTDIKLDTTLQLKEHPAILTAEEIADNLRGVGSWVWNGTNYLCDVCGCGSRENNRFCKFCGARMRGLA